MTREEAIKKIRGYLTDCLPMDCADEIDEIIEALEQPCEDCISREQAKSAIRDRFKDLPSRVEINTILNELPSVTPQPKIGHWVRQTDDYHDYYECEYCGIAVGLDDIKNYCPNCGAKMVESEL
jgi:rubrerythrin